MSAKAKGVIQTVCDNLRGRRLQRDITQKELAETLKMKQPVLSKIERGIAPSQRSQFRLSLTKLVEFAKALEVDIQTLFVPNAYVAPAERKTANGESFDAKARRRKR